MEIRYFVKFTYPIPPNIRKKWPKSTSSNGTAFVPIYNVYMSSYADPGFDGYVVLYCTCLGCIVLYCKYRNTAVVLEPLGRGLGVNGGWRETDFWDVCTTQHFSFYPDIYAKHLGGWMSIQKYSSCVTFNKGGTTSPGPIFFWKNWILHWRTGPQDSETAGGIAKEVCFYFWRLFFQWNWATGRKSRGWSNVAKMTFGSNLVCVNMFPIKKN